MFSVSGDRVHISGPDKAQIGSNVSLICSSQESNPPSLIRWRVEGEEKLGSEEVSEGLVCGGVTTNHCLLYVRDPRDSIYPQPVHSPVITILPLYSSLRPVNFSK